MGGLDKGSHWLTLPTSGRIKRTPNPRLDRERVQQSWGAFTGASENASPFEHRDKGDAFSPALLLVPRELPAAILIQGYFAMQNGRKDTAPFQTRHATYLPVKAVDAEYRPPQRERFGKRATKLRAISRACPRRSPFRECCRGGELLSTCRTLLQINVARPKRDIVGLPVHKSGRRPIGYSHATCCIASREAPRHPVPRLRARSYACCSMSRGASGPDAPQRRATLCTLSGLTQGRTTARVR